MNTDSLATQIKICKLYYEEGLSKIEIGEKVRMSRFKVAKILEDSVAEGVVKFSIKNIPNSYIDLENALEKKYSIYQAIITDTGISYDETKRNMGKAAALHLRDMIRDGDNIGMAWGSTLNEMVESFPVTPDKKNITVIQMIGGLNQVSRGFNPIDLTSRMAGKFSDPGLYQLFAPAVVDKKSTRDILLKESSILETINHFGSINFAVVGIGSMSPTPSTMLYRDGFIKDEDFQQIKHMDLAGDINSHFYDSKGISCRTFLDDRTIGINLEQLKKIRYVMALAGGENKAKAIHAALTGKIVNIIVTDKKTAEVLLEEKPDPESS